MEDQEVLAREAATPSPRVSLNLTVTKKPYSKTERALFKMIPKDGDKISSAKMVAMKKRIDDWGVTFPRNNVTVTMRSLMAKVRHNKEGFVIRQSPRRGPHPVEYWIEERKSSR